MLSCTHERVKKVKACDDAECIIEESYQCKDCNVYLHPKRELGIE